ncbi:putative transcriptional regulator [Candidatus Burkholderia humilis]|nr:putative transcriptional regulator [Candidatus Burkholderia humilis]
MRFMQFDIRTASDIGVALRAARKAQNLRQDDAAGSIGVSESFLGKVENGAESVHWGKLFQVLEGLGVHLAADIPDDAGQLFAREQTGQHARAARSERRRRLKEQADVS